MSTVRLQSNDASQPSSLASQVTELCGRVSRYASLISQLDPTVHNRAHCILTYIIFCFGLKERWDRSTLLIGATSARSLTPHCPSANIDGALDCYLVWFSRRGACARLTYGLDCRSSGGGGRHDVRSLYQLGLRSAHGTRIVNYACLGRDDACLVAATEQPQSRGCEHARVWWSKLPFFRPFSYYVVDY